MSKFRLLLVTGCVLALGSTARAAEPPTGPSSDVPVFILGGDDNESGGSEWTPRSNPTPRVKSAAAENDTPTWNLSTRSTEGRYRAIPQDQEASALPKPITARVGNTGVQRVTSRETQELTSWARQQGSMLFTADDIRAAEAWARDFESGGTILTSQKTKVPTVPPAGNGQPANGAPPPPLTGAVCGPDGCCGPVWDFCNTCCCARIFAGGELLFLVPFGEPDQRVRLTDLVTGESRSGAAEPGLGMGGRVWFGIEHDCCGGFRVRYMYFGEENIDNEPRVPRNPRFAFHEGYDLNLETLDLEIYQNFVLCCHQLQASIGARYAQYQRNTTVLGYGTLGNGVDVSGFAVGAYEAEGVGITASIGGICPLECHCGWSWFWNVRGSYIWADTLASATTEANAITGQGLAFASAHARNHAFAEENCEGVFIGEAQLGLEYEKCLCCLPATFYFRVGLEYQHWELGDPRARTGSFAFLQGGPPAFGGRADAFAKATDGDLDLIGFVLGCGLRY